MIPDKHSVSVGRYARAEDRRMKAPRGECRTCDTEREAEKVQQSTAFHPPHDASPRCESGGRDHCSCSTCF